MWTDDSWTEILDSHDLDTSVTSALQTCDLFSDKDSTNQINLEKVFSTRRGPENSENPSARTVSVLMRVFSAGYYSEKSFSLTSSKIFTTAVSKMKITLM